MPMFDAVIETAVNKTAVNKIAVNKTAVNKAAVNKTAAQKNVKHNTCLSCAMHRQAKIAQLGELSK